MLPVELLEPSHQNRPDSVEGVVFPLFSGELGVAEGAVVFHYRLALAEVQAVLPAPVRILPPVVQIGLPSILTLGACQGLHRHLVLEIALEFDSELLILVLKDKDFGLQLLNFFEETLLLHLQFLPLRLPLAAPLMLCKVRVTNVTLTGAAELGGSFLGGD